METNFVLITAENQGSFRNVLPIEYVGDGDRISIGCYDNNGYVLGAVSFVLLNDQIDVDWLLVDPEVRRMKVATKLMDKVIAFSSDNMEFYPMSAKYCMYEDNMPIHEFFVSYGKMDVSYSHERFLVKAKDIALSPVLHKRLKNKLTPRLFFNEPPALQRKILALMEKNGKFQVEDYEAWKKLCVKQLCRCDYIGNVLMDLIFIQKRPDGNFELSFLYSRYPEGLMCMICNVARDVELQFNGVDLSFDAVSTESENLARKIFPGAESRQVFEALW